LPGAIDRRVTMPKVKLPTANPSKKAVSSKKAASSSVKDSSPVKDVSCVVKVSNLLTDASEMLHREDDMVSCGENIMRNLVSLSVQCISEVSISSIICVLVLVEQ